MEVGALVRHARKQRGLSVEAVAQAVGMSPVTWRGLEKGRRAYATTMGAAETHLGLPKGALAQAIESDGGLAQLRRELSGASETNDQVAALIGQLAKLDLDSLWRVQAAVTGMLALHDRQRLSSARSHQPSDHQPGGEN